MEWYSGWITSRCLLSAGKERVFILDLRFGVITNQRTHTLHIIQLSQSSLSTCAKLFLSCLTLYDPLVYNPPGSSVHGILQARILEQVAISFSRGSSWPRDQTSISCSFFIAGRLLLSHWIPHKAHYFNNNDINRSYYLLSLD